MSPHTFDSSLQKYHRQLFIGDIHGCLRSMRALWDKLQVGPTDLVIFLGDYIDKGPNSAKVIYQIQKWQNEGLHIICIRGNHEEILLQSEEQGQEALAAYTKRMKSTDLVNKKGEIITSIKKWLQELPYFVASEKWLAAHAGFDLRSVSTMFQNEIAMLTIRNFEYQPTVAGNRTILHGHNPMPLTEIQRRIAQKEKILGLDNGCVYKDSAHDMQHLLCYSFTEGKLILQKNIEH